MEKDKLSPGGIPAAAIPEGSEVERKPPLGNGAPDRLSVERISPFYDEYWIKRVGIKFNGAVQTKVVEYCVSEGWIRRHTENGRGARLTPRGKLSSVAFKTFGEVMVVVNPLGTTEAISQHEPHT